MLMNWNGILEKTRIIEESVKVNAKLMHEERPFSCFYLVVND